MITLDLANRLRAALDRAEAAAPGVRAAFEDLARRAHDEAADVLSGVRAHSPLAHLAGAWEALRDDVDSLEHHAALVADRVEGELPVHVSADGTLWGVGPYLQLDPGWTEALIHYLENRDHKAPFVTAPRVVDIPDRVSLAIVGDWGTGYWRPGTGAQAVATAVAALAADYTIHLGDVYYAGSSDEERTKFLDLWPSGAAGSFTLNSNHEMYDGGASYFAALDGHAAFAAQGGCSYLALRNAHWLVIGLDTAYVATDLYLDGAIEPHQLAFLRTLAASAGDRRILLLTHHEGLSLAGDAVTALWNQVVEGLGRPPTLWYWGHAHNGVVYAEYDGCRGRCVGHGAIPYGAASMFAGSKTAVWSETELAGDRDTPKRVKNGFARLVLDGAAVREELLAEDGTVRWSGELAP